MSEDADRRTANKQVVMRFNREVIEQGNVEALHELVAPDFVNRTAPPGMSPGADGMWKTLDGILRRAFPDLRVEIHDQIAEDDKVTTRKTLHGTHEGELFGIAPTHASVAIQVIDIVRVEGGRYVEHWSVNTLASVVAQLRAQATPGP